MTPVILYRDTSGLESGEVDAMREWFLIRPLRSEIPPETLVVGRMSVLPFYEELEADLAMRDCRLINSHAQHRFVADLKEWVEVMPHLTPATWHERDFHRIPEGPYVLKGATNSRKHRWSTHMFARTRDEARDVLIRLRDDDLLSHQGIYLRRYEPLRTLMEGVGGQPITEEYRIFVCDGVVLAGGFYWSSHVEDLQYRGIPVPRWADVAEEVWRQLLAEVVLLVGDRIRFWVVDVARREDGTWMVVELNDGQMSGISACDPGQLYGNLRRVLDGRFEEVV